MPPRFRVLLLTAVLFALGAGSAQAATPSQVFNAPGQRHANVCVRLAGPTAPLRFANAAATGFALDDQRAFADGRCPAGTVRLDLHELIPSSAGPLAFHRGGNGYYDDGNVKYGELATSDIADPLPAPVPSSGGRGAACTLAPGEPAWSVDVESIPDDMHYKRPQDVPSGVNKGASFMHYGDPGADQGSRRDIHYSYLLWSFVNVRGGGIVRTLLEPGKSVRMCDVDPVTMDSWDETGAVNGTVTARYVRILAGTCPIYGWMVWSHDFYGDPAGPVPHAVRGSGGPPPDPAPDPACPVQGPAAAPDATTGDAAAAGDGTSATLAGTVNPNGVVGSYRFEYGTGSEYGAATPELPLNPDIVPVPVSAAVGGLQPGATYHYRLVATSTHGTTYGPDRTLTTPAPAPPPPPPPPPPDPVSLTDLRLSPTAFRRTRSRTGISSRIRYTVSMPAAVTLTFERRTTGVRKGVTCAPAPRGGIRRGMRKCTRWVRTSGSLRQDAAAGANTVRFGGWVGRRALPSGRYRLRAASTGPVGGPGEVRNTYFTLR